MAVTFPKSSRAATFEPPGVTVTGPVPDPPAALTRPYGRWAWTAFRLACLLPVYAPAYLVAGAMTAVWCGAVAGYRDVQWFTGSE
jgi:hypothetical protein